MTKRHLPLLLALGLAGTLARPVTAQATQPHVQLQAAIHQELVEGDLERAVRMYSTIVADGAARDVTARALFYLGRTYEKLGSAEAVTVYRRLAGEYGDQAEIVRAARARLAALGPGERTPDGHGIVIRQVRGRDIGTLSVSPDGRYLSFVDWAADFDGDTALRGHADLAIYDTQAGRSRVLTNSPPLNESDTYVVDATFAPDSRRIAYSRNGNEGHGWNWQLHVVDLDGRNDRLLVENAEWRRLETAAWSPDGAFLLIQIRDWDGQYRIATVSLRDGAVTMVKTLGRHQAAQPLSLSPDGRYIVYDNLQGEGDARHDVFILATDGSSEGRLVTGVTDDDHPLWTPDGRHVVFRSDRLGRPSLWAVEVSNGQAVTEPELLRPDIGTMIPVGFDAGGTLYYRSSNRTLNLQAARLTDDGTDMVDESQPITDQYVGTNAQPSYSPDGTRVAYLSFRGPGGFGDPHVVVRSLQTGVERAYPMEFTEGRRSHPMWASDGQSIAMVGTPPPNNNRPATFRLDLATGVWSREPHLRDVAGNWRRATDRQIRGLRSRNTRFLFSFRNADLFADVDENLLGIFETGLFRARPGRITDPIDDDPNVEQLFRTLHIHSFALSPDGLRLAFASAEDSTRSDSLVSRVLRVIPIEGGQAVEVFRVSGNKEFVVTRWAPGANALLVYVASEDDPDADGIWRVPLDGGQPVKTRLALTQDELQSLAFHPDGVRFAFHREQRWGEVWAMEGFPWAETATR